MKKSVVTNAGNWPPRKMMSQRWKRKRRRRPALRFTPTAWAKLLWLRDAGPTEVGGFGIARSDDPLRIDDVRLVAQTASPVTVEFDDDSVADLFDELVDAGLKPSQFGRIWIHTHPGDSATPSGVDETTFDRCFGGTDWSVMAILARDGATYARLRFHVGPGGDVQIPVRVDWTAPFGASDHAAWNDEYQTCVRQPPPSPSPSLILPAALDPEHGRDADWPWPEWERFEHESQPLPSPHPPRQTPEMSVVVRYGW